jgi:hypothetical protein
MSLAGGGVVAIWNDITDEGRANFYEWHNREHIPERVGIDGFLRGRRYIALAGEPEYFTLYEVRDRGVLGSESYLARLNAPTSWTTESVRHFRNVSRSLCATDFSRGAGSGGYLGTLRFDTDPATDEALLDLLTGELEKLLESPAMVAAHICRADVAVSTAKTAEQKGRPDNVVPRWVVMVEGSRPEPVTAALDGPLGAAALEAFGPLGAARGTYVLEFDLVAPALAPGVGATLR